MKTKKTVLKEIAPSDGERVYYNNITQLESFCKRQDELMKKYGWVLHYVTPDERYPFNVNIHTHGFPEKFKHPDMQILEPISMEFANGIMWNLARRIEAGDTFQPLKGKGY